MIFVEGTPNNAGVAIYGDYMDFNNLYNALHDVIGDEEKLMDYYATRIRVLAICYDLRHALMGHREYEFFDNGLDEDKKRYMEIIAPDKNLYLKINVLWPEILFVMIALNDFIQIYAEKQTRTKNSSNLYAEPKASWDFTIANVRMLQAAVANCLEQILSPRAFTRLLNLMNGKGVYTKRYATQYIDILNDRLFNMSSERRRANISIFAKRISEKGREYKELVDDLEAESIRYGCRVDELQLNIDFPDEIDW